MTAPAPTDQAVIEHLEALRRLGRDDLIPAMAEALRPGDGTTLAESYRHTQQHQFATADVTGHNPADWAAFVLHLIDTDHWQMADAVFGRPAEPGDITGLEAFAGTNRQRFTEQRSGSRVADAWLTEHARHTRASTPELHHVSGAVLDWTSDPTPFASDYLGQAHGKAIYYAGETQALVAVDEDTGQYTVLATGINERHARRAAEKAAALLGPRATLYDLRALATAPSPAAPAPAETPAL